MQENKHIWLLVFREPHRVCTANITSIAGVVLVRKNLNRFLILVNMSTFTVVIIVFRWKDQFYICGYLLILHGKTCKLHFVCQMRKRRNKLQTEQ